MASIAIAICLLIMGGWTVLELTTMPRQIEMFSDLGAVELPLFTRIVWGVGSSKILHALALVILLGGVACLVVVKDRLRANVYALVAVVLLASLATVIRLALWLPMTKVITEVTR